MNIEQVLLLILLGSLGIGLFCILLAFMQFLKTPEQQRYPKVEIGRKQKLLRIVLWFIIGSMQMFIWYSESGNKFTLMSGILFWLGGVYYLYNFVKSRNENL